MKVPLFTAQTEWIEPEEFPDLRSYDEIAVDLETRDPDLKLKGSETFDIGNIDEITSRPGMKTEIKINYENQSKKINVLSRIDTEKEIKYFKSDGILPCVLKEIEANIE